MPYRLIHFSPGLVEVEVSGYIDLDEVNALRTESEIMRRHLVEPFDAVVDATEFTGLNPLVLPQLRELPVPAELRAVAVVLAGWLLVASRALPGVDGLIFAESTAEARAALAEAPPLAIDRSPAIALAFGAPPQIRRVAAPPLPPYHRRSSRAT